jgi:hypothetical protein
VPNDNTLETLSVQVEKLARQVELIVQILQQQEHRGWMSGNSLALQADREVKRLLEKLRKAQEKVKASQDALEMNVLTASVEFEETKET